MNESNNENIEQEQTAPAAENVSPAEETKPEETAKPAKKQAEIQNGNPAARKHTFNKRNLKHGTMAVVLTVLFIAAVVVLNVIVSIISDRIDTTADLTDTGIYTLDEATTNYLAGLDKDVTVSVMNTESSFEGGSSFYKSVNELLNKMAMENEHFKLQYLKIDQLVHIQVHTSEIVVLIQIPHRRSDFSDLQFYFRHNAVHNGDRTGNNIQVM